MMRDKDYLQDKIPVCQEYEKFANNFKQRKENAIIKAVWQKAKPDYAGRPALPFSFFRMIFSSPDAPWETQNKR